MASAIDGELRILAFLKTIVREQGCAYFADFQNLSDEVLEEFPPVLELLRRKLILIDLKVSEEMLEEGQRAVKEGGSFTLFDQSGLEDLESITNHREYQTAKLELHFSDAIGRLDNIESPETFREKELK